MPSARFFDVLSLRVRSLCDPALENHLQNVRDRPRPGEADAIELRFLLRQLDQLVSRIERTRGHHGPLEEWIANASPEPARGVGGPVTPDHEAFLHVPHADHTPPRSERSRTSFEGSVLDEQDDLRFHVMLSNNREKQLRLTSTIISSRPELTSDVPSNSLQNVIQVYKNLCPLQAEEIKIRQEHDIDDDVTDTRLAHLKNRQEHVRLLCRVSDYEAAEVEAKSLLETRKKLSKTDGLDQRGTREVQRMYCQALTAQDCAQTPEKFNIAEGLHERASSSSLLRSKHDEDRHWALYNLISLAWVHAKQGRFFECINDMNKVSHHHRDIEKNFQAFNEPVTRLLKVLEVRRQFEDAFTVLQLLPPSTTCHSTSNGTISFASLAELLYDQSDKLLVTVQCLRKAIAAGSLPQPHVTRLRLKLATCMYKIGEQASMIEADNIVKEARTIPTQEFSLYADLIHSLVGRNRFPVANTLWQTIYDAHLELCAGTTSQKLRIDCSGAGNALADGYERWLRRQYEKDSSLTRRLRRVQEIRKQAAMIFKVSKD